MDEPLLGNVWTDPDTGELCVVLTEAANRFFYEYRRNHLIVQRRLTDRLEAVIRAEQPPPAPFRPLDQKSLNALTSPWTMACWTTQSDDQT